MLPLRRHRWCSRRETSWSSTVRPKPKSDISFRSISTSCAYMWLFFFAPSMGDRTARQHVQPLDSLVGWIRVLFSSPHQVAFGPTQSQSQSHLPSRDPSPAAAAALLQRPPPEHPRSCTRPRLLLLPPAGDPSSRKEGRREGLWLLWESRRWWFCGEVLQFGVSLEIWKEGLTMSSRSPPPKDRRMRTERTSYRDAPYRRDSRRGPSRFASDLCNNCKRPGHFARDCPNVAVCHTCGLPGHIAAECSSKGLCWNCKEPGHMANSCPNEGICHNCGKSGHIAKDCTAPPTLPGEMRLCSNCYKPGHIAAECTNEKACNNCRKSGHLARNCTNEPVCNLCNVEGHLARQCPKSDAINERGGPPPFRGGGGAPFRGGYSDVVCRACNQVGHMSRDCMAGAFMICHNCGGRGHMAYECPSGRLMDRFPPRRY